MTAEEFLRQSVKVRCKLSCSLTQIQDLQDLATRITPIINGTPTVSNKCLSKIENAVINIQSQSETLGENIVKYLKVREEIADAISLVIDENERLILTYRYLTFQTWKKIAREMNITPRRALQLHAQAILSIEKIFESKK